MCKLEVFLLTLFFCFSHRSYAVSSYGDSARPQKQDTIALNYKNSFFTTPIFLIGRSHLGYERKISDRRSLGINVFYFNAGDDSYFDLKTELFWRRYSRLKKEKYVQIKILIGYHIKSDIGCGYHPEEELTGGIGINWGRKYFLKKSNFYLVPDFGFKYYRFPFYYYDGTPNCEHDYERIFYIDKMNWYLYYPGSLFEFNFVFGYVFK